MCQQVLSTETDEDLFQHLLVLNYVAARASAPPVIGKYLLTKRCEELRILQSAHSVGDSVSQYFIRNTEDYNWA